MTLEEYKTKRGFMRRDMLCEDELEGLAPLAEAHVGLALTALASAQEHLEIAGLFQAQALTAQRVSR